MANGRKLLECVSGEAEWNDEFVVQSGGDRRHVRYCVAPMTGVGLFFEETFGGIGLSRIVHRYHNFSVPRIVRERIQAVPVSHVKIGHPNAGGIIEAWKDFGFLNGKRCGNARYHDSKYGR